MLLVAAVLAYRQFWRQNYRPADPTYWYGINLEDPNDRGYDAVRRLFLIEIVRAAEVMFRRPSPNLLTGV
jgi:hypothetical protein